MDTYQETKELYYCRLRVPKDEAYFLYFTLEANEGMAYYSTLEDSLSGQYRDIDLRAPIEWKENLLALINRLQKEIRLDIVEENTISDS
jgi:HPt (histidine-containing phosphotransfer) domain-containing protein